MSSNVYQLVDCTRSYQVHPAICFLQCMVVSKAARPVTLTFDLESGVRVTCDVGYFCANFGLPTPLCSRLTHDVRDRQTSDRRNVYVCLCTCLSVIRRCCVTVKTVKPILKLF